MKTDNSAFKRKKQNKTITALNRYRKWKQPAQHIIKNSDVIEKLFQTGWSNSNLFFTERNCNLLRMVYLALLEKFSFYLIDCSQVSCCKHISHCELVGRFSLFKFASTITFFPPQSTVANVPGHVLNPKIYKFKRNFHESTLRHWTSYQTRSRYFSKRAICKTYRSVNRMYLQWIAHVQCILYEILTWATLERLELLMHQRSAKSRNYRLK